MKQKSRLELLMKAINTWLELPKVSRSVLAAAVAQAVDDLNLATVLANEATTFTHSDDIYNDARVNAQKIFRWLGQYADQNAVPERLFFVEQALLAAMPVDLRISYLNDVYNMVGVTVVVDHVSDGLSLSTNDLAATLTKENCEAQIAVIRLGVEPTRYEVEQAYRELRESRGTTQAAMDVFERSYPYLSNKSLKSVG